MVGVVGFKFISTSDYYALVIIKKVLIDTDPKYNDTMTRIYLTRVNELGFTKLVKTK